jgi:3-isopropylmalate/(R)-2-methylmalate dehydratase large subunit
VCNMTIAEPAQVSSPDATTTAILAGEFIPADRPFEVLAAEWTRWASDAGCRYDHTLVRRRGHRAAGHLGHFARMVTTIRAARRCLPSSRCQRALFAERALEYMGLAEGTLIIEVREPRSSARTNGRIEDLRDAAKVAKGHKIHSAIDGDCGAGPSRRRKPRARGSTAFLGSGFERCLASMSGDERRQARAGRSLRRDVEPQLEGRYKRGRTHLVSPAMAVAAVIRGRFTDVRAWTFK